MLSFSQSKEFEGIITYQKYFERITSDQYAIAYEEYVKEIGETNGEIDYYYKNGKHKWWSTTVGSGELFYPKLKYLYIKLNHSYKNWQKHPIGKTDETVMSAKITDETQTILGYTCKVFEIKTKKNQKYGGTMVRKFYFSPKLFMNYKTKKAYKYGSQNIIAEYIKALPLKILIDFKGCVLSYTAIKVEKKAIEDDVFETPPTAN